MAFVFAAGCATRPSGPTGYAEQEGGGTYGTYGYKDKNLGPDEFSVFVTGNPKTSLERTKSIAMLRAARLAREKGYALFSVLTQKHQVVKEPRNKYKSDLSTLFRYQWVGTYEVDTPVSILVIRLLPRGSSAPAGAHEVVVAEKDALSRLAKP